MKKTSGLLCVLVCVGLVSMASGEILITNGDFESGLTGNGDDADVVDWYESNEGVFWFKPWLKDGGVSHNGTAVTFMSAYDTNVVSSAIDGAGLLGFVYQNIGTADGAWAVTIGFDTGVPSDGPDSRDYGITFTILESDGSFVPGAEVDVLGAAGVTVIDQQTQLYTDKTNGDVETEEWAFDLSSAGAGDLYLRFNHYSGTNANWYPWIGVDNIAAVVVASPATVIVVR
jgi:hypothetical protein